MEGRPHLIVDGDGGDSSGSDNDSPSVTPVSVPYSPRSYRVVHGRLIEDDSDDEGEGDGEGGKVVISPFLFSWLSRPPKTAVEASMVSLPTDDETSTSSASDSDEEQGQEQGQEEDDKSQGDGSVDLHNYAPYSAGQSLEPASEASALSRSFPANDEEGNGEEERPCHKEDPEQEAAGDLVAAAGGAEGGAVEAEAGKQHHQHHEQEEEEEEGEEDAEHCSATGDDAAADAEMGPEVAALIDGGEIPTRAELEMVVRWACPTATESAVLEGVCRATVAMGEGILAIPSVAVAAVAVIASATPPTPAEAAPAPAGAATGDTATAAAAAGDSEVAASQAAATLSADVDSEEAARRTEEEDAGGTSSKTTLEEYCRSEGGAAAVARAAPVEPESVVPSSSAESENPPAGEAGPTEEAAALSGLLPTLPPLKIDDGCLICRSDSMNAPVTLGCLCGRIFCRRCIKHLFKGRTSRHCEVGRRRLCPHCLQPATQIRPLSTTQELGRKLAALLLEAEQLKAVVDAPAGEAGSSAEPREEKEEERHEPASPALAAESPNESAFRLLISQAAFLLTILTLSFKKAGQLEASAAVEGVRA